MKASSRQNEPLKLEVTEKL